jgi:NADH-quinone oxidoreductase subunit M
MHDLTVREKIVSALLVIAIVWLGLFPQPVFNTARPALLKTLDAQREKAIQDQVSTKNETAKKKLFLFSKTEIKY